MRGDLSGGWSPSRHLDFDSNSTYQCERSIALGQVNNFEFSKNRARPRRDRANIRCNEMNSFYIERALLRLKKSVVVRPRSRLSSANARSCWSRRGSRLGEAPGLLQIAPASGGSLRPYSPFTGSALTGFYTSGGLLVISGAATAVATWIPVSQCCYLLFTIIFC